jgi:hypothetical protein
MREGDAKQNVRMTHGISFLSIVEMLILILRRLEKDEETETQV